MDSKQRAKLIDAYRDAVSQRVAFNSPEHHAAETAAREALLGHSQAVSVHTPTPWRVFTTPDGRKLVGIGDQDGQGILDAGFGVWSWQDADGIANAELVVKAVNSHDDLVRALGSIAGIADNLQGQIAREALLCLVGGQPNG